VLARLGPHLEPCQLSLGQELHRPGEIARDVYFPIQGVISVVATMKDGTSVEISVAGREGMFNVSTILGDDAPFQSAMVQIPGSALRLRIPAFRQAAQVDEPMRTMLLRYTQATLVAVGQSAACNRLHAI
jgi:CRP-like cAMP-binding protein